MSTENTVDKVKLISELKEIHSELFQVYKKLFDFKYKHDETFKVFIDNEYKENGVGSKEQKAWNDNFCHRASYTLLNKILFVRICEDKGFMRNAEDYIAGEVKDPHIGEKLSKVGLQKWGRLITNYTLGELIKFAFNDMKQSYSNIVLYKEDKYEVLNPRDEDFNLKYMDGDKETKTLVLSFENVLSNIIEKLDTNNFNFKYTDGNILGDVYEKFMDRETRKAIGQFYTPEFVIEYILKNTAEKADVVENPFVTVADISCGSGHFLIMAYDILREKFMNSLETLKEKYAEETYALKKDGKEIQLTGREYWVKEHIHYHILKHCIYGADIDSFAVQLTTINLLLKDLDNFTDELNIIECDSLIKWEVDYNWQLLKEQLENEFETITTTQTNLFGEEEKFQTTVRKENYQLKYKDIAGILIEEVINREKAEEIINICNFWNRKFNYVVGNPPYGAEVDKDLKEKLKSKYPIIEGKNDIYALFIYRNIEIADLNCKVGLITPNTYLGLFYYDKLRKLLIDNYKIEKIIDLPNKLKVFEDVNIDTVIGIFGKKRECNYDYEVVSKLSSLEQFIRSEYTYEKINYEDIIDDYRILISEFVKPKNKHKSFDSVCTAHQGGAFVGKDGSLVKTPEESAPYLSGTDIDRYFMKWKGNYIPLDKNKVYSLGNEEHYQKEKIVMQRSRGRHLLRRIVATKDNKGFYCALGRTNYLLPTTRNINEILGVLNSKYINYYYTEKFGFSSTDIIASSIRQLPYPMEKNDLISQCAERILNCYEEIVKLEHELNEVISKENILNAFMRIEDEKINANIKLYHLENIIDMCVYKSFNIGFNEIMKVEEHQKSSEEIPAERKMLLEKLYSNFSEEIYEKLSKEVDKIALDLAKEKISRQMFIKLIEKDQTVEQIAVEYNMEYSTVALLRNYYLGADSKENLLKYYNLQKLFEVIQGYLNDNLYEILSKATNYKNLVEIKELLSDNIMNFNELISLMRKENITKKTDAIIKESLNLNSYTWNAYRKDKAQSKINKTFVKYYDSDYYGLTEWTDEIHKQYFMDAIDIYTVNSPNEKKAKDILDLFKDLNIEDKEDYVDIIEDKIKRAFS